MSSDKDVVSERPMFVLLFAGFGCFMLSFLGMGLGAWIGVATGMEVPEGSKNPYKDENGEVTAIGRGRETYINEGCWHCHSQFVRPVANEEFRYGPVSQSWEAMYDVPNTYGTRRIGPDLSREAGRRSDDWHLAHLYNPRSTVPASIMPSYPWMFEKTDEGVKPTEKANDLVAYLQYLGIAFKKEVREQVWPQRVTVSGAPNATEPQRRRGSELFDKHCVGCHGADGDGDGLASDFLAPSAADLTMRYLPREEVFRVLFMGSEGSSMPSYAELTEKDLWALAIHVSEMGKGNRTAARISVTDERVRKGKEIYLANGCQTCHGEEGVVPASIGNTFAGGPAPKHFKDRLYHPDYVKKVMAEGRPGSAMVGYPEIQGEDLTNIIAYMNSLFDDEKYKEEK